MTIHWVSAFYFKVSFLYVLWLTFLFVFYSFTHPTSISSRLFFYIRNLRIYFFLLSRTYLWGSRMELLGLLVLFGFDSSPFLYYFYLVLNYFSFYIFVVSFSYCNFRGRNFCIYFNYLEVFGTLFISSTYNGYSLYFVFDSNVKDIDNRWIIFLWHLLKYEYLYCQIIFTWLKIFWCFIGFHWLYFIYWLIRILVLYVTSTSIFRGLFL